MYWPGLRDGDWYSMTTRAGSGSSAKLTVGNASGLARVQYAWGSGTGGGSGSSSSNVCIENAATGMYVDGAGATSNGSAAKQYSGGGSTNQQWEIVAVS